MFFPSHRSQTRRPRKSVTAGMVGSEQVGQVPEPWQSAQAGGSAPHWTQRIAADGVRAWHAGHVTRGM